MRNDITIDKFEGLNISDDPELIGDKELQSCLNFDITPENALVRRPSITNRTATSLVASQPVYIMGHYLNQDKIIAASNNDVYESSNSGASWTLRHDMTGTTAISRGVNYTDSFYYSTIGGTGVVKLTGTTPTAMASSPGGEEVCIVNDRLFVLNIVDQKIYYSEPGIASWNNSVNQISVAGYGGTPVGMIAYRDKILVFKRELCLILFVSGAPTSWLLRKFPYDVGCTSRSAYIVQDDLVYFIGPEGVYRSDLGNIQEISQPLQNVFKDRYSVVAPVIGSAKSVDSIGYWNDRIFCLLKVSTTAASAYRLFVFHTKTNAWSEWLPNLHASPGGFPFLVPWNFYTVYLSANNEAGMYFSTQEASVTPRLYTVKETGAPTDDPNGTYTCSIKTKKYTLGASNRNKRCSYAGLVATGLNNLRYTVDGVVGSNIALTTRKVPGPGRFRGLEIELSGPNAASNLPNILNFTLTADKKTRASLTNV